MRGGLVGVVECGEGCSEGGGLVGVVECGEGCSEGVG